MLRRYIYDALRHISISTVITATAYRESSICVASWRDPGAFIPP